MRLLRRFAVARYIFVSSRRLSARSDFKRFSSWLRCCKLPPGNYPASVLAHSEPPRPLRARAAMTTFMRRICINSDSSRRPSSSPPCSLEAVWLLARVSPCSPCGLARRRPVSFDSMLVMALEDLSYIAAVTNTLGAISQ